METYMGALLRATKTRLTENTEVWGDRVHAHPPLVSNDKSAVYPYIVCTMVGGGKRPLWKFDWAEVQWQIRVVSDNQAQAYVAHERISELFNNADYGTDKQLSAGDDWIITSTQELMGIDFKEGVDSDVLYHTGAVFHVCIQEVSIQ